MSNLAFNKPVNINPNPFGLTFYVSNTTNPTEDQGSVGTTAQGRSPKNPFATIAAAITEAVSGRGDVIVVQRGTYSETLTVNKAGLTIVGAVSFGYPDHVVISGITSITASGCSFYNLEFFSNSGDGVSTIVGAFSAGVNSTWFENCSFASNGTTEPEAGSIVWGGNNTTYKNCKFIDNTFGLVIHSNTNEFASHVSILGCEFLEQTTSDISTAAVAAAAQTVANSGGAGGASSGVRNFRCEGNFFGTGAVTPTTFVNIVGTSSGTMTDNRFGSTVHASSTIVIPTGIFYADNAAEEGRTGVYSGAIGTSGRPD